MAKFKGEANYWSKIGESFVLVSTVNLGFQNNFKDLKYIVYPRVSESLGKHLNTFFKMNYNVAEFGRQLCGIFYFALKSNIALFNLNETNIFIKKGRLRLLSPQAFFMNHESALDPKYFVSNPSKAFAPVLNLLQDYQTYVEQSDVYFVVGTLLQLLQKKISIKDKQFRKYFKNLLSKYLKTKDYYLKEELFEFYKKATETQESRDILGTQVKQHMARIKG